MKTIPIQLGIVLLAGAAAAQPPRDENGHRPPPPPPPFLGIFDTDHDGELSAREIRKAADVLAEFDRNGDRQITRDEMRPPPPEGGDGPMPQKPPGHPPSPVIAALDTNRDGSLSAEELKAAPESLLGLDKDSDGELSPEELHPDGPPPPPEGDPDQGPDEPVPVE